MYAGSIQDKPHGFHIMRVTATPAKLVATVRATEGSAGAGDRVAPNSTAPSDAVYRLAGHVRAIIEAEKEAASLHPSGLRAKRSAIS